MLYLTELGEAVLSTPEAQTKLDRYIKNVLSFKPILSVIFKETVIECRDMEYDDIERCIEGDVQIDVVGVHPGMTNPLRIEGRTQENAVIGEGTVTFDLRTILRIPNGMEVGVKLLVNVEAQKDDSPGYDISERAIFYCARMLSAQLSTEFTNSTADKIKYGNLKKVYSIWICTETPQYKANTIERFTLQRNVQPNEPANYKPRFDLMEAIIVNLSKEHNTDNSQSELINILTSLFDENISNEKKISDLARRGIRTTEEFEQEVDTMTAYAARLVNEGYDKGYNDGKKEIEKLLAEKDSALAEKDSALAEKDSIIKALKEQLNQL